MRLLPLLVVTAPVLFAASPTRAADPAKDKSQYDLFHPTPQSQMREMSTDRPDVTESPFTVDAGHYQIEASFFEYSYDHEGGLTQHLAILPTNLKVGLFNNVDLQLLLNPYERLRTKSHDVTHRVSGFGNMTVRLKVNLTGNDGGDLALGVMPFITFPTGHGDLTDGRVTGGVIVPVAFKLPHEFDLGAMAEFDFVRDADNSGYGVDFVHTVTLGHEIVGQLDGFIEYAGFAPSNLGQTYRSTLDVGVTYAISDNVQLDAGTFIGLTKQSDDVLFFVGISVRR